MVEQFVHLSLHSEYSLVDSTVRIKPLCQQVAAMQMPAVAITDQCNLFGLVKFYRQAESAGIKPIIGCDLLLVNSSEHTSPYRLQLLCQNRSGYRNLTRLISRSYLQGQEYGRPMIESAWLTEESVIGLIALSGGVQGEIGQHLIAGREDVAIESLQRYQQLFGDRFYLELHRTDRQHEQQYIALVVNLASEHNIAVVATNDVRFLDKESFDSHEVRVCISQGRTIDDPRRSRSYSAQQYLRSTAEMVQLFADIPEALENSVEIAKRCNLELEFGKNYLPDFPIPDGLTEADYFRKLSREGLEQRLPTLADPLSDNYQQFCKPYRQRLEIELDVIIQMGFPGYFLIVADFIRWAKSQHIPVGPGRGSGAGSLVAYALTITDLDPLQYELLFERFLNPERVSMPDFDIDFCMDGRDRVIDYVAQTYGREKVSQIITYGRMAAKAVVRDVGRVLGHPFGFVDKVAKLIPFELKMTIDKALQQEEQLLERYQQEEDVRFLLDMAKSLEGLARQAGKHAGGVVIAPTELSDFAPLYCEPGSDSIVTQFDKDDVEAVGLVKFDFLGLRTLTVIDWAIANIRSSTSTIVDINAIPLNDVKAFNLLKACQTTAIFQLESAGMKKLIARLQPDCFEDIIALVALFRPGPLQSGMVDDFIDRKQGRAKVQYPHPDLEHILQPTYGVIVYQEQVMQIAQILAGYTLGGADLLRRAMGKKKAEEMAKQRAIFTDGALANGVEEATATYIFDLMEKFAEYGFNKSHSAAYALVSYQTAWLKAHYPAAYMAAFLSADMDKTDKVVLLISDCEEIGLQVLPPTVNHSAYQFTVLHKSKIVYGLGAIKGVGLAAIEGIVAEREQNGPFSDLFAFCERIDLRKCNRRVLETLIRCGACDGLGPNRASMFASLPTALQMAEQKAKNSAAGIMDIFGLTTDAQNEQEAVSFTELPEWDDDIRLRAEKETLGLYLTGHPIKQFLPELANFTNGRLNNLQADRDRTVVIAGLVVDVRSRNNKKGDRMAAILLDDHSARIEATLFAEEYIRFRDLLVKDTVVVAEGTVSNDEYNGGLRLRITNMHSLDGAREYYAKTVSISLQGSDSVERVHQLEQAIMPFRNGSIPLLIHYQNSNAKAQLQCDDSWRIHPSGEFLRRSRRIVGEESVWIDY